MKKAISVFLALVLCVTTFAAVQTTPVQAASNKETIFEFLTETVGLNAAASCGLMSNMYYESSYDPTTSYYGYNGLFQWSDSDKWGDVKSYCEENGYDHTSLTGQLHYINYELRNVETEKYQYLKALPNTGQGAYDAAYYWCYYYEKPADRTGASVTRGNYAKTTLFPEFGGSAAYTYNSERWKITTDGGVNCRKSASTSAEKVTWYNKGTTVTVLQFKTSGGNIWAKTADGWFALRYDGEYYAAYQSDYMYKITYNANGGSFSTKYQGRRYGGSTTLTSKVPTRSGYAFLGWSKSKTAATATYKAGGKYSTNANVTLYAVWKRSTLPATASIATASASNGIKITWKAISGATGYRVYCKSSASGSWSRINNSTAATSYTDKTAKAGTTYYYTVRGIQTLDGKESLSKYNSAGVAGTYLKATTITTSAAGGGVKITWKKITGASAYRVYRKSSASGSWSRINNSTTATSYTDKTAKAGTTYYYTVRGIKTVSGKEHLSYYKSTGVVGVTMTAPSVKTATVSTGVKVTWSKVTGASSYRVYRKSSASGSWSRINTSTTGTSYIDKTAAAGKSYYYTVRGIKTVSGKEYLSVYNAAGVKGKSGK